MRDYMTMGYPSMLLMGLIVCIVAVGVVIPMVNILLVLFLAFAEWPLERRLSDNDIKQ